MLYISTLLNLALVSTAVAVILIISGCGEEEKDPVFIVEEGWTFYEAGKYEIANRYYLTLA